jgi:flagellin
MQGSVFEMMGLSINTNTASLNTVRNLSMMQRSIRKTGEKLSSGQRINRAADDPAGLVISEQMRSQIGSIAQEITNLDNAISKNKTADSFLMQLEDRLLEMREMAVAATSSGNLDEKMVEVYENEMNNSASAFNSVVDTASFGTKKLLDGSEGSVADVEDIEQLDLSTADAAEEAIEAVDDKLAEIHEAHGELGATIAHEYESMRSSLEVSHNNLVESESSVRDTDMAIEQTSFVSQMLRIETGAALLAQGNLMAQNVYGLID